VPELNADAVFKGLAARNNCSSHLSSHRIAEVGETVKSARTLVDRKKRLSGIILENPKGTL